MDDCNDILNVSRLNTATDVKTVPQSGSGHGLATTASDEQDMRQPETEMSADEPEKPQPETATGRKAITPSVGDLP